MLLKITHLNRALWCRKCAQNPFIKCIIWLSAFLKYVLKLALIWIVREQQRNHAFHSESMRTVHCETKCERDKKLQCCKSHINVHYIVHYKVSGSLNVHQKEQGHTQLATWACKVTENGVLQRENVSWGVCLCLGSCDTRITEQKFSSERRERTAVFPLRLINPGLSEYEGEWRGSPEQGEGPPAISATVHQRYEAHGSTA